VERSEECVDDWRHHDQSKRSRRQMKSDRAREGWRWEWRWETVLPMNSEAQAGECMNSEGRVETRGGVCMSSEGRAETRGGVYTSFEDRVEARGYMSSDWDQASSLGKDIDTPPCGGHYKCPLHGCNRSMQICRPCCGTRQIGFSFKDRRGMKTRGTP
jgi:hypothetical protein